MSHFLQYFLSFVYFTRLSVSQGLWQVKMSWLHFISTSDILRPAEAKPLRPMSGPTFWSQWQFVLESLTSMQYNRKKMLAPSADMICVRPSVSFSWGFWHDDIRWPLPLTFRTNQHNRSSYRKKRLHQVCFFCYIPFCFRTEGTERRTDGWARPAVQYLSYNKRWSANDLATILIISLQQRTGYPLQCPEALVLQQQQEKTICILWYWTA